MMETKALQEVVDTIFEISKAMDHGVDLSELKELIRIKLNKVVQHGDDNVHR